MFTKKTQVGFTIVELMISAAVTLFLVSIVGSFIFQVWDNQRFVKTHSRLQERMQMTLYKMGRQLSQSRKIFGNDLIGNHFKSRLPFTPLNASLMVLPTVRNTGSFVKNQTCDNFPQSYYWPLSFGNSLYFVQLVNSFDKFEHIFTPIKNPALNIRSINLYQFVAYYVQNQDTSMPVLDTWNATPNLRSQYLIEWKSALYADYQQYISYMNHLSVHSPGDQAAVRTALINAGVVDLWNPNSINLNAAGTALAESPFYDLTATSTPPSKTGAYKIIMLSQAPAILLKNDDVTYSIAYNTQSDKMQANFFPIKTQVPTFYNANPNPAAAACGTPIPQPSSPPTYGGPAAAFPGGFEIGVIGPNSGRSVMINLTMLGKYRGNKFVEHNHKLSAYAKDL